MRPRSQACCAQSQHRPVVRVDVVPPLQVPLLTTPRSPALSLAVVQSVEEAADTDYAAVVVTTKALPDVLPTEVLLKPLIDAGRARTFLLIQVRLGRSGV